MKMFNEMTEAQMTKTHGGIAFATIATIFLGLGGAGFTGVITDAIIKGK